MYIVDTLNNLIHQTAFFNLEPGNYAMIVVALVFLLLAIKFGFEPLLLVPIAFGMLLVNIYPDIWRLMATVVQAVVCCIISTSWMSGQSCRP